MKAFVFETYSEPSQVLGLRDLPDPARRPRVVLLNVIGTWRQRVVCPAGQLVVVPGGVSDDDAAQAIVNPGAAWMLTVGEHRLAQGELLTQTAAGSTVGRLVLQLARSEGSAP